VFHWDSPSPEAIHALRKGGYTYRAIAHQLHRSFTTISADSTRGGEFPKKIGRPIPHTALRTAIRIYPEKFLNGAPFHFC
jgi:hypothetical protein